MKNSLTPGANPSFFDSLFSSILPHQYIIPSKYLQQLLLDQCLTQHLAQMLEYYILPFCFSRSSLVNPVFKKNIFSSPYNQIQKSCVWCDVEEIFDAFAPAKQEFYFAAYIQMLSILSTQILIRRSYSL